MCQEMSRGGGGFTTKEMLKKSGIFNNYADKDVDANLVTGANSNVGLSSVGDATAQAAGNVSGGNAGDTLAAQTGANVVPNKYHNYVVMPDKKVTDDQNASVGLYNGDATTTNSSPINDKVSDNPEAWKERVSQISPAPNYEAINIIMNDFNNSEKATYSSFGNDVPNNFTMVRVVGHIGEQFWGMAIPAWINEDGEKVVRELVIQNPGDYIVIDSCIMDIVTNKSASSLSTFNNIIQDKDESLKKTKFIPSNDYIFNSTHVKIGTFYSLNPATRLVGSISIDECKATNPGALFDVNSDNSIPISDIPNLSQYIGNDVEINKFTYLGQDEAASITKGIDGDKKQSDPPTDPDNKKTDKKDSSTTNSAPAPSTNMEQEEEQYDLIVP